VNPDLRSFIIQVSQNMPEDVLIVKEPLSIRYEPTAYVLELAKKGKHPLVVFENLSGSPIPVVTNIFGARRRYAVALNTNENDIMKEWVFRSQKVIPPRFVKDAPIKDCIKIGDEVDLNRIPVITHFQEDAGPYITAGIVVAKDPESGIRNASFHRCQIKDRNTMGISLHSRRHLWDYQRRSEVKGKNLEVAIIIGCHPLILFGTGLWKGSIDADEYDVAGGFLGEPLEVIQCETIDLDIPAQAEIILEGEILAGIREDEGPFGEFTGYSSHNSTRHVVKVKAITHRQNAIYQDIVPGLSQEHNSMLAVPAEPRLLEVLKKVVPSVKDVAFPFSGVCRFHCYISMKKIAEGQPKTAVFAAFAEDTSLKLVVVVDEDIDVKNEEEVLWAIATCMQADRGIFVIPGCMGAMLDPSAEEGFTAKMGIDATRPLVGWKATRCTIPNNIRDRIKQIIEKH
jgi:2,5-furandicarboxylate decarboxylase 1